MSYNTNVWRPAESNLKLMNHRTHIYNGQDSDYKGLSVNVLELCTYIQFSSDFKAKMELTENARRIMITDTECRLFIL